MPAATFLERAHPPFPTPAFPCLRNDLNSQSSPNLSNVYVCLSYLCSALKGTPLLFNPSLKHVGRLLKKEKCFFPPPEEKGPTGRLKLCGHAGSSPLPVSGTALTQAERSHLAEGLDFGKREGSRGIAAWLKAVGAGRRAEQGQEKSLGGGSIGLGIAG